MNFITRMITKIFDLCMRKTGIKLRNHAVLQVATCWIFGSQAHFSATFKMVDVLVAVVLFLWLTYLWENYLSYRQVTMYD